VLKRFTSIWIWKKNKCQTISIRITCLIYTTSMHFSYEKNTYPSIHAERVECNYFPWPSKFEMQPPLRFFFLEFALFASLYSIEFLAILWALLFWRELLLKEFVSWILQVFGEVLSRFIFPQGYSGLDLAKVNHNIA
jgi:hypothetical protein